MDSKNGKTQLFNSGVAVSSIPLSYSLQQICYETQIQFQKSPVKKKWT